MYKCIVAFVVLVFVSVSFASGNGDASNSPQCNMTESWKNCVGNRRPCPCYDRRNDEIPYSVEKYIFNEYNRIIVQRTYFDAYNIFDQNIQLVVRSLSIFFNGIDVNVGYLFLGDPNYTDLYQILAIYPTNIVQEDNKVTQSSILTFQNVQDGHIFNSTQVIEFTFNNFRKIVYIEIHPDVLTLSLNLPAAADTNITAACNKIQTYCPVGTNLQQFTSIPDCQTFMQSIPFGSPQVLGVGNSYTCRSFHSNLINTPNGAQIHCPHTGPNSVPCS
jgi:hypothetical protein